MKKNQILIILILSFVFVVAWTGFGIYHTIVTPTISEVQNIQITPISPTFDTNTIADLKKRQNFTPVYQLNVTVTQPPSISNPVAPTPLISSASAKQSTSGGTLLQ